MTNKIEHKGFIADVHLEGDMLVGVVTNLSDGGISFEAATPKALYKAFREAVDHHLDFCRQEGIDSAPVTKRTTVRLDPEIHARAHQAAEKRNISFNEFVNEALRKAACL